MIKINHIATLALLAAASFAHAETTSTSPLPGDQGITSVNRNLDQNPDNKGLQNASEKLEQNRLKHAERVENREEKREQRREDKRIGHTERHDGMNRPERLDRPGK